MPLRLYKCESCGKQTEKLFPQAHNVDFILCACGGQAHKKLTSASVSVTRKPKKGLLDFHLESQMPRTQNWTTQDLEDPLSTRHPKHSKEYKDMNASERDGAWKAARDETVRWTKEALVKNGVEYSSASAKAESIGDKAAIQGRLESGT